VGKLEERIWKLGRKLIIVKKAYEKMISHSRKAGEREVGGVLIPYHGFVPNVVVDVKETTVDSGKDFCSIGVERSCGIWHSHGKGSVEESREDKKLRDCGLDVFIASGHSVSEGPCWMYLNKGELLCVASAERIYFGEVVRVGWSVIVNNEGKVRAYFRGTFNKGTTEIDEVEVKIVYRPEGFLRETLKIVLGREDERFLKKLRSSYVTTEK